MSRRPLEGIRVVLGVSGSIAAYKAADIASRLVQEGAMVDVLLTEEATKFIAPLTFRSLTNRPVPVDMFDVNSEVAEAHVELARAADALVVAPATASMLARLAHGLADDMVSLTAAATRAPLLLAPAMDSLMWESPATQANVAVLRERGAVFVGPVEGRLASGRVGSGRMVEPGTVVEALKTRIAAERGDLVGKRIVVSAGGTREPIDPVRFVGNHSSGKMGYAIAEAARDRGAAVTLLTTVRHLPEPYAVSRVDVGSAREMLDAVRAACEHADALVMAAAVADFRPTAAAEHKIKKSERGDRFTIDLEETEDILLSVSALPIVRIGFAAESHNLVEYAQAKLKPKGLAFIVANDVTQEGSGFGTDTNAVTFVYPDGRLQSLPLMSKYDVAHEVLDRLREELGQPTT